MLAPPERRRFLRLLVLLLTLAGCRLATPPGSGPIATSLAPREAPPLPPATGAETPSAEEIRVSRLPSLPQGRGEEEKVMVRMVTSLGEVTIEVYPKAAPLAAKRFLELTRNGFYDETPICRVVEGYAAQFGVNWRAPYPKWSRKTVKDDPVRFAVTRGCLTLARSGANKGATQVQIHLRDNPRLAQMGYAPFARVVEGLDVVERFAQVGDPSLGLDQGRLWTDGEAYLETLEAPPTMIEAMEVVSPSEGSKTP